MIVITMARTPSLNASNRLVRMAPTIADGQAAVEGVRTVPRRLPRLRPGPLRRLLIRPASFDVF